MFQVHAAESNVSTNRKEEGHCVWYGICNNDKHGNFQYCPSNTTALPLDPAGEKLLATHCPHLLNYDGQGNRTCCNTQQLVLFDKSIEVAATILGRCPSCLHNLKRHICDFSCSPTQSTFMEVAQLKKNVTDYISAINLYVSNDYLDDTFKSCKQVSMPSTGQLALDLMCGNWAAARCSPLRWFTFMGTPDDQYVPFQRNYLNTTVSEDGFTPYNPPLIPCSKPVGVSQSF